MRTRGYTNISENVFEDDFLSFGRTLMMKQAVAKIEFIKFDVSNHDKLNKHLVEKESFSTMLNKRKGTNVPYDYTKFKP